MGKPGLYWKGEPSGRALPVAHTELLGTHSPTVHGGNGQTWFFLDPLSEEIKQ